MGDAVGVEVLEQVDDFRDVEDFGLLCELFDVESYELCEFSAFAEFE
jgi:hypothetical protein